MQLRVMLVFNVVVVCFPFPDKFGQVSQFQGVVPENMLIK